MPDIESQFESSYIFNYSFPCEKTNDIWDRRDSQYQIRLVHVYEISHNHVHLLLFFSNTELDCVSQLVFKPYNSSTNRNVTDITNEIYEKTNLFLTYVSGKIGSYQFINTNQSLQMIENSGKLNKYKGNTLSQRKKYTKNTMLWCITVVLPWQVHVPVPVYAS